MKIIIKYKNLTNILEMSVNSIKKVDFTEEQKEIETKINKFDESAKEITTEIEQMFEDFKTLNSLKTQVKKQQVN